MWCFFVPCCFLFCAISGHIDELYKIYSFRKKYIYQVPLSKRRYSLSTGNKKKNKTQSCCLCFQMKCNRSKSAFLSLHQVFHQLTMKWDKVRRAVLQLIWPVTAVTLFSLCSFMCHNQVRALPKKAHFTPVQAIISVTLLCFLSSLLIGSVISVISIDVIHTWQQNNNRAKWVANLQCHSMICHSIWNVKGYI